jgi:hypothetical protein
MDVYEGIRTTMWSSCGHGGQNVVKLCVVVNNVVKKEGAEGLTHGSFLNVIPNGAHDLPQAPAFLSRLNDDLDFPLLADHIWPSVTHSDYYSLHV